VLGLIPPTALGGLDLDLCGDCRNYTGVTLKKSLIVRRKAACDKLLPLRSEGAQRRTHTHSTPVETTQVSCQK